MAKLSLPKKRILEAVDIWKRHALICIERCKREQQVEQQLKLPRMRWSPTHKGNYLSTTVSRPFTSLPKRRIRDNLRNTLDTSVNLKITSEERKQQYDAMFSQYQEFKCTKVMGSVRAIANHKAGQKRCRRYLFPKSAVTTEVDEISLQLEEKKVQGLGTRQDQRRRLLNEIRSFTERLLGDQQTNTRRLFMTSPCDQQPHRQSLL